MSSPTNPIVSGLMNAFQLANMFQQQRMQQQQLAMQQARDTQAKQMQDADLQMKQTQFEMALQAQGGRLASPADQLEAQTGQHVAFNRVTSPGSAPLPGPGYNLAQQDLPQTRTNPVPSFTPSDMAQRLRKVNGQQYVLPSRDESDALAQRQSDRALKNKVAETTAVGNAQAQVANQGQIDKLKAFGTQVTPDMSAKTHGAYPAGSYIDPAHMGQYSMAVREAMVADQQNKPRVVHALEINGDKGIGVASVMTDGTVQATMLPQFGKKAYAPDRGTSANEQRLADKAATDAAVSEAANRYAAAIQDPEKAVAQLRQDVNDSSNKYSPFLKKNFLGIVKAIRTGGGKPNANDPDGIGAQIDNALGSGAPAPAAATPVVSPMASPTAAPKGKANGNQIRSFAKAKGLSFAAAVAQAKKEGYDVTGLETSGRK